MIPAILITRPVDDVAGIADITRSLGFDAVFSPVLKIADEPAALPAPENYAGLIFSSINGVRAFLRRNPAPIWFSLPVFAVGPGSEAALRDAGFTVIYRADGTMRDLIILLQNHFPAPVPLLHIRGRDVRDDPAVLLPAWPIDRVALYRAEKIETLDRDAQRAFAAGRVAAVLLYSARSGEAFVSTVKNNLPAVDLRGTRALCLADSVLESVRPLNWAECRVATSPDQSGMIRLLEELKHHVHHTAKP